MTDMRRIIGVDFDNTLICYDDLMYTVALESGLIDTPVRKSKKHIRDSIVMKPGGETEWQKLQATVYGERIGEAVLFDGAEGFLSLCGQNAQRLYIVSHKSEYASMDRAGINLREAALGWMRLKGFFDRSFVGIGKEDVFFESTRKDKCERIRRLGCTHFIDDLEEVYFDGSFPEGVEKILFDPHGQCAPGKGIRNASSWKEISDIFFG
jgi:hypothetical protein